jgi:hypothetical protein
MYDTLTYNKKVHEINTRGVQIKALITRTGWARGCNLYLLYNFKKKTYTNSISIRENAYASGDSISISFLPEEPDGTIVLKQVKY